MMINPIPHITDQNDGRNLTGSNSKNLHFIFENQQTRFRKDRYPDYSTRISRLQQLYQLIDKNSEALVEALNQDFGYRYHHETELAEVIGSLSSVRYLMKNLYHFMKPQKRQTSIWFAPAKGEVRLQPLGVVGIMAPWNYSVHLTIAPIAAALAAGNCVMAKMSELTPNTSDVLKQLISESFTEDVLTIIDGDTAVSKEFSSLPFQHLLFTGSTRVGKSIAQTAAKNMTPVTLELSGKSPVFIDQSYNIEEAAQRIIWGKTFNAGQTCVAPDYVLVHQDKLLEFVRAARVATKRLYPNGLQGNQYTSIINSQHFQRLQGLIEDARSKGCEIIELEKTIESQRKLAPALVIQPTPECKIFSDELFGPVLPIFTYKSDTDAIRFIDQHCDPLALYIFTRHKEQAFFLSQQLRSGTAVVNDTLVQYLQNDLPFGGVGKSGIGKIPWQRRF